MHRRVLRTCLNDAANLHNITRILDEKLMFTNVIGIRCLSFDRERNFILNYSEEVEEARKKDAPIVALESTIITHGMPYPDNLETAVRVENIIREKGAVPATIAIFDGKIRVGMEREQLKKLSECAKNIESNGSDCSHREEKAIKCSRRDISMVVSNRLIGGTTVGGTMTIARMAGIPIMATGGIGGVHRGAETSFDISSDLVELSRNPVAVVCAGVKAILDIPKTLEYLETQGVPVVAIGDSTNFPAFYSRETSPIKPSKAPIRVADAQEAAKLLSIQETLSLGTGILFAIPIPKIHALDPLQVESVIREALIIAEEKGIHGKYVTPFLLKQLNQLTSGGFLKANQALVENNARVAAEIAIALSRLRKNDTDLRGRTTDETNQLSSKPRPVVIGGATIDTVLHVDLPKIELDGRTHRAKRRTSYGGVGRNVAAALIALGLNNTRFITAVGEDAAGRAIVEDLDETRETIELLSNSITPSYTAILDNSGECRFGVGEMDTFDEIDSSIVNKYKSIVEKAGIIILDGNAPLDTMRASIDLAGVNEIPVWFEPTDVRKASKIFETGSKWIVDATTRNPCDSVLQFISPNVNELIVIAKYLGVRLQENNGLDSLRLKSNSQDFSMEFISNLAKGVAEYIPIVITTLGSRGLLVTKQGLTSDPFFDLFDRSNNSTKRSNDSPIQSRWYQASIIQKQNDNEKFSVSGCGDCLAAGIITGMYRGFNETECISFALEAAAISLRSHDPVPRDLHKMQQHSAFPKAASFCTIK